MSYSSYLIKQFCYGSQIGKNFEQNISKRNEKQELENTKEFDSDEFG